MKLELSEEQVMIRNMIREFAEKEIAPLAAELDEKEIYPAETLKKLAALGILVILRTILSRTLSLEVEGRWPWQPAEGS